MVMFCAVTHVHENRRNPVCVYMEWRQPALLSKLRSSAQGLLRLLSAIKARNWRPILDTYVKSAEIMYVSNLKYFKIIFRNVWRFRNFVYLCSKLEKFKIRTGI